MPTVLARSPGLAGVLEQVRSDRARSRVRGSVLALFLALPALWAVGYFFPPLNHDVAALLQFAGRMLDGERLYVDLVDINPPAIFLIDMIPVAAARVLGVSPVTSFVAFVLALCGLSWAMSWQLLRRIGPARAPAGALLWPALIGFALLVYPMHSFGQREHLLLVFSLPYAIAAAARAAGTPIGVRWELGTALFALAGIMLKPYFALVPLALELLVLARCGWRATLRRPRLWLAPAAILAGCVAYVIAVAALLPAYFLVIVPLVAQCYEQVSLAMMVDLLTRDQVPALLLPLIPLAAIAFRLPGAGLSRALVCLVLATTGAGFLQGKGWDYHFFAARASLVLLAGAIVLDGLAWALEREAGLRALRLLPSAGIALTVMALVFAFSGVLSPPFKGPRNFVNTAASRFLPVVQAHGAGQPVLWLTTSIYPQFPVLNYTDSPLAMPFMSLWALPALYAEEAAAARPGAPVAYHAPDAMSDAERLVWRGVIDGLVRRRPALLLVEDARREGAFRGLGFDYLAYFGRDPAFAAALADYAVLTKIDNVTVYKRR